MGEQDGLVGDLSRFIASLEENFEKLKTQVDVVVLEDAFLMFMEAVDGIVQIEEIILDFVEYDKGAKLSDYRFSDDLLANVINDIVISYQEGDFIEFKRLFLDVFELEFKNFKKDIEEKFMQPALV